MREVEGTSRRPEVRPDFKDDEWQPVNVEPLEANNLGSGHAAVYRAGIELTEADLKKGKLDLNLGRIDDLGWVYVNGKKVGETTDWSRPYSFEVTKQLRAGHNVIAVIVRNNEGSGGLGAPTLSVEPEGTAVSVASFGASAGIEGRWWETALNDRHWETASIGPGDRSDRSDPSDRDSKNLLTWYRLNFKLAPPKPGVWVPWRLRLNANGNGFLYLNGHPIGRYWQAGPQHDFFLPECWLNFGHDQTNLLTLSLRPAEKGAAIQSALVEPYAEFAEKR